MLLLVHEIVNRTIFVGSPRSNSYFHLLCFVFHLGYCFCCCCHIFYFSTNRCDGGVYVWMHSNMDSSLISSLSLIEQFIFIHIQLIDISIFIAIDSFTTFLISVCQFSLFMCISDKMSGTKSLEIEWKLNYICRQISLTSKAGKRAHKSMKRTCYALRKQRVWEKRKREQKWMNESTQNRENWISKWMLLSLLLLFLSYFFTMLYNI